MTKPPTDDGRRWLAPGPFAGWLGLLVVVSFPDVLTGAGTFVLGDFNLFGYPLAHHAKDSLLRGEIPLWNPLNNCGLPFLAQWNTMVLYPPAWLHLMFPLSWWLGVFCLLHLYLGGLGMYRLARRRTASDLAGAVAGVAWAFSGLTQSSLMWPNNSAALGLLPWVLLVASDGVEKGGRRLALAVLIGSLQMLAGAPEIVIFTWLFVILEWLACERPEAPRRTIVTGRFALLVVGVSAVCAAQLLPFLDLLGHSQRAGEYLGGEWAASPFVWGNFVVPLFHTVSTSAGSHYQSGQFWIVSTYAGIGTLLLAVVGGGLGRAMVWRWWLVVLCLVLAMGDAAGLYPLLEAVLPLGVMRYPAKFLVPIAVLLPLLAASGVARVEYASGKSTLRNAVCVVGGLLVVTVALIRPLTPAGESADVVWFNAIGRAGFLGAAVLGLRLSRWRSVGAIILIVSLWLDLRTQQRELTPTVSRAVYDDPNPTPPPTGGRVMLSARALGELRQKGLPSHGDTAVLQRLSRFDNLNLPDGVAKIDGFWSLYLPAQQHVEGLMYDGPDGFRRSLADFCSVVQVTSADNIFQWRERTNAMPLVTGGQRVIPVPDEEALARLADPQFAPRREVLVVPDESLARGLAPGRVIVSDLKVKPHEWRFKIEANTNTVVVVSQAFHPNWRATVNGAPGKILRANHAFQALAVPAGSSEVQLVYQERMFTVGTWISLFALLTLVALWRRAPG